MSTLTSTQVQAVADGRFTIPADPLRVNVQHVKFTAGSAGGSLSTGDVIQMVALPAWSRIIDGMLTYRANPASYVATMNFGGTAALLGTYDQTISALTNITRLTLGASYLLSISEGAAVQFDTIDLTMTSVSETTTCDIHVWVAYTYEPNLRS